MPNEISLKALFLRFAFSKFLLGKTSKAFTLRQISPLRGSMHQNYPSGATSVPRFFRAIPHAIHNPMNLFDF
ncbi:hypothetical protein [Phytobacter diazotrophicus]|uniref:hypothetical protein n=1 Tax=Phytobacter diazotrophicus TaxID=395631 RepID=UPI0014517F8D|nr:hypothetical protein [Phytobacter diazotrophicus]QJF19169.1 hypothetical protein HHA33_22570 [Phytobacter diazotrophicus]